jgi:hypothetical protein
MLKLDEQREDRSKSDEKCKSESSVQKTFSMKLEQDEYKIKVLTLEDLDEKCSSCSDSDSDLSNQPDGTNILSPISSHTHHKPDE